jgi:tRNA dimethylallyltransferase
MRLREDFLPVILGPTAVGKTELALDLAQRLNAEIVSADSMQIYRRMNIGTAKPNMAERRGIPHHLIDIVDPDTPFTVSDYQQYFDEAVESIRRRGRIPLVVGGTGLYIRAVTRRFRIPTPASDVKLREKLKQRAAVEGPEKLFAELKAVDPLAAQRIHPNDQKRVIRALEVYLSSGRPISDWLENAQEPIAEGTVMIGLEREREALYERINLRVDQMVQNGLLDEVKALVEAGYSPDLPSMQGLGYKELIPVIQGEVDLENAVELLKKRTRNYAKRQISWFKREPVHWFSMDEEYFQLLRKIISFLEGREGAYVE